jgi:hypothetical protein
MSSNKFFSTKGLFGLFALLAVGVGGFLTYQSSITDDTTVSQETITTTESQSTVSAEPKATPVASQPASQPTKGVLYQPEVKPSVSDPANAGEADENPIMDDCPSKTDNSNTDESEAIPGC